MMDLETSSVENGDYEYLGSNIENCGELCLLKDEIVLLFIKKD